MIESGVDFTLEIKFDKFLSNLAIFSLDYRIGLWYHLNDEF